MLRFVAASASAAAVVNIIVAAVVNIIVAAVV